MLSTTQRRIISHFPRYNRTPRTHEAVAWRNFASTSTATPPSGSVQRLYFVPRNTRGNIPVYTDVRNAGGRYTVLVRNIEGSVAALAKDLSHSLFEKESHEASQLRIQISQSKHLIISGGRWKNDVLEWLKGKGF
ncbi:hypothetical protein GALMADRAFT_113774 [Galerina marginata CBS 339.88]|uniref:Large ribosomal subunit protein mL49 n=1 Tax=Galerina marginata (strain CBS 339.88) TaxID=685588 RepID=A0A067TEB7_GALM3|nr:hypothetical protein GALMADRAFT_113774 [Galerina marginata CBS 339.88]